MFVAIGQKQLYNNASLKTYKHNLNCTHFSSSQPQLFFTVLVADPPIFEGFEGFVALSLPRNVDPTCATYLAGLIAPSWRHLGIASVQTSCAMVIEAKLI